jgi:hypothetical protein
MRLPRHVRETLIAMASQELRTQGDLIGRMPAVPQALLDVYAGFQELDRDGFSGAPTMAGMRQTLDEMGLTDRSERAAVRRLWRVMEDARRRRDDELKEAEKTTKAAAEPSRPTPRPIRRPPKRPQPRPRRR